MNYKTLIILLVSFLLIGCSNQGKSVGQPPPTASSLPEKPESGLAEKPMPERFKSPFSFEYPEDGVKGIYVTGPTVSVSRFDELLKLVETTELNSMVIDIKDDFGLLQYQPEKGSPFEEIGGPYIKDPEKLLKTLEEKEIYPIARVVVFKDNHLASQRPDLSFTENGKVWKNGRGESFVNPFMKEVWEYNVEIAKEAAKMGFKDIQFDYVRFPEGFETRDSSLKYSQGDYSKVKKDNVQKRVDAVTDFVAYAKKELEPYNVDVSVDIFGYSATLPEAPGIGQNFSKISANVDAISSMIYPSHWTSYFGIEKPDLQPYEIISEYAKHENKVLGALENRPVSRPWIQDFTASYLGAGNYKKYGKAEVEAQIRALNENGIDEFLLWNAANRYTKGVDYTPLTP
ncbi:GTP-binding protein [Bacillus sp. FJAT-18017]|uniref:putative glycoside hydrolase n=1 Tax=Bacillus sp. FJAT-18017 TaxID=1705566 RepID=UPI0006AF1564|nr:putative glycoside hydrolase [Bacillus sp. FJAT-18017]ALC90893.1 GTP-binding protein [Bacillus sp. FJAT-18017]